MKRTVLVALLLVGGAFPVFAQQTPTANPNGDTPAVATPGANNPDAPVEGANSFTEDQARERMEEAGYTGVKDLKKDDRGVWMASGMKGGKNMTIALDYQGNLVAR